MPYSDHVSNEQFWLNKWRHNREVKPMQELGGETRAAWEAYKQDPRIIHDDDFHKWVSSDWFNPARFPTRSLMKYDMKIRHPDDVWDPNPEIARMQAEPPMRPKSKTRYENSRVPDSDYVEMYGETAAKHTHESMRGTGVPEHVTVYRFGKMPRNAMYGSGSVDPNWPQAVRSGWRSKDINVNNGPLHIHLVPHQDIIHEAGAEGEVFFRRGTQLNKVMRSAEEQKQLKYKHRDSWEGFDWEEPKKEEEED